MITKKFETGVGSKIKYKIMKDGYETVDTVFNITEDLDVNTVLNYSPSSTVYTSDLEYEVNQDLEAAPLMNLSDITLPNSDTILGSDKLWYPYDDGKQYKCSKGTITKKDNFNRVGSVKISDGVVSGFSSSNYLTFETPSFNTADSWEIVSRVKISTLGKYQFWFYRPVCFGLDSSNHLHIWGTPSEIVSSQTFTSNTWYTFKIQFTGTKYITSYKTDDSNWEVCASLDSTTKVSEKTISYIGLNPNNTSEYLYGEVDLGSYTIKIDNTIVWKPEISDYEINATKIGSISVDKDWNASGFNGSSVLKSSYSIPSKPATFEFHSKFTTGSITSSEYQSLLSSVRDCQGLADIIITSEKLSIWISSNGSNDDIATELTSAYSFESNTTYYMLYYFNGSTYKVDISTDDETWTNVINLESTAMVYGQGNLIFGADQSGNYGCIFNGSIDLSEYYLKINNKKVWEGIKYQEYDTNYTIVGSPTISDKQVISNMTTANYLDIPYLNMNSTSYEICCEFTLQNTYTDYRCFFVYGPTVCYFNMAITNDAQPKVYSNTGNGSNWYTSIVGTTPLELNKSYLVKCCRVNGIRTMYLSSDGGKTWSNEGSISDTYSYSNTYRIGQAQSSNPSPNMSMDLTKCYVKINDIEVWRGAKEKSSYYQGIMDSLDDYNPQGGTYKLFSCHKDGEEKLIATSQNVPTEENDYYQYIQQITIPEFIEYQYTSNDTWAGMTDVVLTLDQDDAEFSLEEVE